ncbi:MAG: pentapeptide repeat-containing protein [Candidatus Nanopelagicales bacterium]
MRKPGGTSPSSSRGSPPWGLPRGSSFGAATPECRLAATAANERRARLNKVNFRGVVLRHAHLHEASLVGTNLTGADLTGAIYCRTTVSTTAAADRDDIPTPLCGSGVAPAAASASLVEPRSIL